MVDDNVNANNNPMNIEFNRALLTSNNNPLNFYLDGFDVPDFLQTTAIIHKYGGNVTPPDIETVVLSTPDRISATKYLRFHINWLYDSMRKDKLQDIGQYLLPTETISDNDEKPLINETVNQMYNDARINEKSSTPKYSNNIENLADDIPVRNENTIDTSINSFTTRRRSVDSIESDDDGTSDNASDETCTSSTCSKSSTEELPPQLSPALNRFANQIPSKVTEQIFQTSAQMNRANAAGSKTMPSTPVSSNSTVSSTRGRRRTTAGVMGKSCCNLPKPFLKTHMKATPVSNHPGKITQMLAESGIKKPVIRKRFLNAIKPGGHYARYSCDEEQRIVNYLINNNLISEARSKRVAEEMTGEGVLPNRTAGSISSHIRRLVIRKYTKDVDVIKQFDALFHF